MFSVNIYKLVFSITVSKFAFSLQLKLAVCHKIRENLPKWVNNFFHLILQYLKCPTPIKMLLLCA